MVWKKRWTFEAKKEKTAEWKCWNRWKCKNIRHISFFLEHGGIFSIKGKPQQVRWSLNEHGDLYFLLHKNIVHIILLNLEKKLKKLSEGKKDIAGSVRKTVTPACKLSEHENNNSTNALRPRCFTCEICPQILYDIVLYAPHFLPVKFFPKCYFNKVCFELLQNLTWTDE